MTDEDRHAWVAELVDAIPEGWTLTDLRAFVPGGITVEWIPRRITVQIGLNYPNVEQTKKILAALPDLTPSEDLE